MYGTPRYQPRSSTVTVLDASSPTASGWMPRLFARERSALRAPVPFAMQKPRPAAGLLGLSRARAAESPSRSHPSTRAGRMSMPRPNRTQLKRRCTSSRVRSFSTSSRAARFARRRDPAAGGRKRPSSPVHPDQTGARPGNRTSVLARSARRPLHGQQRVTPPARARQTHRLAARCARPVDRSRTPDARAGAGGMRYILVAMSTRNIAILALVIVVVVVIVLFVL